MKKRMHELRQYTNEFIQGEEGMELLQVAIVLIFVVGLITVVGYVFVAISTKIGESGDAVMDMDTDLSKYNTNPNNSNSTQAANPNP